ncbi:MAG: hypothetical protein ABIS30_00685 [Gallionella sp.]
MKPNKHKVANLHKMPSRTLEREAELIRIEREAFASFQGQFDDLELALGILRTGDYLGWRPLVLIHNKRTIRKVEDILGINFREFFPPEGSSANRSQGYKLAKQLTNFWKAVSGDTKIDNRREIGDST